MRIGITCYPTYGGSGIVATELGLELANRGAIEKTIAERQSLRRTLWIVAGIAAAIAAAALAPARVRKLRRSMRASRDESAIDQPCGR